MDTKQSDNIIYISEYTYHTILSLPSVDSNVSGFKSLGSSTHTTLSPSPVSEEGSEL